MSFEKVLDTKLDLIKSQRDVLHESLDDYLKKLTSIGKATLDRDIRDFDTFKQVNSLLDGLLEFLIEKCVEVDDIKKLHHKEAVEVNIPSSHSPSCSTTKQTATKEYVTSHSDTTLGSSNIENVKTDASSRNDKVLETTYGNKTNGNFQLQDESSQQNKDVIGQDIRLSDVKILLQEIKSKFADKLSEAESKITKDTEEKFKQINVNFTSLKQSNSKTFQDTVDKIKKMEVKHAEIMETVSKVGSLEKRLKKVEGGKKTDAETIQSLSDDIQSLKSQYNNNKKQTSTKVNNLEKQMETLTAQSGSMQSALEDFQHLKSNMEDLRSGMGMLADKKDLIDVMKSSNAVSQSVDELSSRVGHVEKFVKDVASYREREENKRRELEDRILVLEENRRKDLETYEKKLDEVESQYKEVCQIVDNRVTPLRRLQYLLNEYHKTVEKREELSGRLDDLTQRVTDISDKVLSIDTKTSQGPVGFTAYFPSIPRSPAADNIVLHFKDIYCNEGNQYSSDTGIFTAPRDGLYMTSVTIWQRKNGAMNVDVLKLSRATSNKTFVCTAATHVPDTNSSGIATVFLSSGDQLNAKITERSGNPSLSPNSSFSCFLVG